MTARGLSYVDLAPIRVGDPGFPAGFPSTVNAELLRHGPRRVLTAGLRVADWLESHCVNPDGKWIGRPARLMPWQVRFLVELFIIDEATMLRLFRWGLVGLPKKNGKSALASWLGLYMLAADGEPAPLVIVSAASEDQADIVFGGAHVCADLSPTLSRTLRCEARRVVAPSVPRARMVRVAAAAGTNDGKNIHCVICDELHEWAPGKHENVWNVLTNGTGAREQPLILQITTAGCSEETVEWRQFRLFMDLVAGAVQDPAFYGLWFEAPELDPATGLTVPYDSPRAVELSSPSYGTLVHWPFFADQLTKKTEATYRRYFLNQHTEADEVWQGAQEWDANEGAPEFSGYLPLYVGIDVGLKHDACAVVWAQNSADGKINIGQHIWENPHPPGTERHGRWRLSLSAVEDRLKALYMEYTEPAVDDEEGYPRPGPAFFYDPMLFERSAQALREDGLTMIDFPQTDMRMTEASQSLFELLKRGLIVHDGDPVMRRHVRATAAKETPRGWRITRLRGPRRPNDGAVAMAMAVVEAGRHQDQDANGPTLHF